MKKAGSIRAIALVLACSAGAAPAAAVPDKDPRRVMALWQVQPPVAMAVETTVAKNAPMLRQDVLPLALDALADDAHDGDGKTLLAKGQLLFRLYAATGIVDCVLNAPPRGAVARFLDAGAARLCLRDGDGDGRFDAYFTYTGAVAGLPSVNGKIPKVPHPLTPVSYVAHDVSEAAGLFYVGIDYAGHAPLSGMPRFVFVYGRTDGEHGSFGQSWAHKTLPSDVVLNGARFTVLEDGEAGVRIHIDAPLPSTAMGMMQAGSNGFY